MRRLSIISMSFQRDRQYQSRSYRRRSRSPSGPRRRSRSYGRSRTYEKRDRRRDPSPQRIERQRDPSPQRNIVQTESDIPKFSINDHKTKPARKLYIGNLPSGYTPIKLRERFVTHLRAHGINTLYPILSVQLSNAKTFCYVEFRSVVDTTKALEAFKGFQLDGSVLQVSRATDYTELPEHLCDFVMPIPDNIGHEQVSSFLMIANILKESDLRDDEEYKDVLLDIKEECETLGGKVVQIHIPTSPEQPEKYCKAFVEFKEHEDAKKAKKHLHLRKFNDLTAEVSFLDVSVFRSYFP